MRIGYSDEEDYPGQFALWQANCKRSLDGRCGQQALRDLRDELLAMPSKRLIVGDLAGEGEVCAVGALLRHRGIAQSELERLNGSTDPADWYTDEIASRYGVPPLVAWKLVELNDMELAAFRDATPEQRYVEVLAWVNEHIHEPAA